MARNDHLDTARSGDSFTDQGEGCVVPDFAERLRAPSCPVQDSRERRLRELPPRSLLYAQGDAATHVYRVETGVVMISRLLPDGRRQIVSLAREGDFFGISDINHHESSAETVQDATIIEYARRLYETSPELMRAAIASLTRQVNAAHDMAVTLGRKSAVERVCTFLLRHVPLRGRVNCPGPQMNGDDQASFDVVMTRQEIADYLGLTIETVSRAFSTLRRRRAIVQQGKEHIRIVNVCALCELASAKC